MVAGNFASRALVAIGAVLLVASRGPCVEVIPESPVPRDSFVEVKTNGLVWVLGIQMGVFVAPKTHKCDGSVIWNGPPGQYVVYGVEEVNGQQQQFQEFVTIAGGVEPDPVPPPNPDPPDPDPDPPNPDPEPLPPLPPGTENLYGIAEPAFRIAMHTGTVADVGRLAEQYARAARYLHEQRLTPAGAQKQLREVRQQLSGDWSEWEAGVEKAVQAAIDKYGAGQLAWRDYCREIAGGLTAAHNARGGK